MLVLPAGGGCSRRYSASISPTACDSVTSALKRAITVSHTRPEYSKAAGRAKNPVLTCVTDVGKSVWSAPEAPPAMFCSSPTTFASR